MSNNKEYARNSADTKIAKIVVDRDLCIGAASCIAVSGTTYELDNENKAVVTGADSVDDATLIMSAESCPTRAILLFDKEGKQVFPK
ncbi:MAG: ferredoxin [Candidatus Taylorbacteria bacterium]|nr:ferredoxin [Candidatus Taylorbacteria bacterium]